MTNLQLPDFSECYTFRAFTKKARKANLKWWQSSNSIRGLSLILYLGYTDYRTLKMNELHYTQSSGKGYKVELHPRNTFPQMLYALKFAPGFDTSIRIKPFAATLLGQPYNDCSNKRFVEFNSSQLDDYEYSRHFCRSSCIQSAFVSNCGCISVDFHA